MKIIIAGGSGFLGTRLANHYKEAGHAITILTRGATRTKDKIAYLNWDGTTIGPWSAVLDGADVLINLNGKSVDCRYNDENKRLIYSTRVDATRVLGKAVMQCDRAPKLWINASSATIYRHSTDRDMDERTGEIGTGFSVDVCEKWEAAFNEFDLPQMRKVILRTGIVLGHTGAFRILKNLATMGAGRQGPGTQYMSWLHETDFVKVVDLVISNQELKGVYNVTAPTPITNGHFMRVVRKAIGVPFGVPVPKWLLGFGALLIGTESELILKSRRVVPKRLIDAGYRFEFGTIEDAVKDLIR
jgi:uncharacterized protein (TIGR01777 family)